MASVKPLVIKSGQVQEIPAGDTLDAAVSEVNLVELENEEGAQVDRGDVVYISSAGKISLAQADAALTEKAFAIVYDASIADTATGNVITSGILTGLTGLTAGAKYFLSAATAGLLTDTPPSGSGEFVRPLGIAMSTTELKVDVDISVLLA